MTIPGAVIDAVFVGGVRIDSSWYEILHDYALIRWSRSEHPEQAVISVKLTEELSTKELTARWKKLAVILPVVSSVVVAIIAGVFSYLIARSNPPTPPPRRHSLIYQGAVRDLADLRPLRAASVSFLGNLDIPSQVTGDDGNFYFRLEASEEQFEGRIQVTREGYKDWSGLRIIKENYPSGDVFLEPNRQNVNTNTSSMNTNSVARNSNSTGRNSNSRPPITIPYPEVFSVSGNLQRGHVSQIVINGKGLQDTKIVEVDRGAVVGDPEGRLVAEGKRLHIQVSPRGDKVRTEIWIPKDSPGEKATLYLRMVRDRITQTLSCQVSVID